MIYELTAKLCLIIHKISPFQVFSIAGSEKCACYVLKSVVELTITCSIQNSLATTCAILYCNSSYKLQNPERLI